MVANVYRIKSPTTRGWLSWRNDLLEPSLSPGWTARLVGVIDLDEARAKVLRLNRPDEQLSIDIPNGVQEWLVQYQKGGGVPDIQDIDPGDLIAIGVTLKGLGY